MSSAGTPPNYGDISEDLAAAPPLDVEDARALRAAARLQLGAGEHRMSHENALRAVVKLVDLIESLAPDKRRG